jgi:hypothetical protein
MVGVRHGFLGRDLFELLGVLIERVRHLSVVTEKGRLSDEVYMHSFPRHDLLLSRELG